MVYLTEQENDEPVERIERFRNFSIAVKKEKTSKHDLSENLLIDGNNFRSI